MCKSLKAALLTVALAVHANLGANATALAQVSVKTEKIIIGPANEHDAESDEGTPEKEKPDGDVDSTPGARQSTDEDARPTPGGHRIPAEAFGDPSGTDDGARVSNDDSSASSGSLPEISYDLESLPAPVRRMREQIIEAAETGMVENLLPVLEANEVMPTLSLGDVQDPILFLKLSSGDAEGREILAILIEVLEAGYLHADAGTPQEMYIWPYFARFPVDRLTPPQQVELFKLLTALDVREMEDFGTYIFYRVGIGPDGTWHFFLAGE